MSFSLSAFGFVLPLSFANRGDIDFLLDFSNANVAIASENESALNASESGNVVIFDLANGNAYDLASANACDLDEKYPLGSDSTISAVVAVAVREEILVESRLVGIPASQVGNLEVDR